MSYLYVQAEGEGMSKYSCLYLLIQTDCIFCIFTGRILIDVPSKVCLVSVFTYIHLLYFCYLFLGRILTDVPCKVLFIKITK
jgi:hypothetical protein